MAYADNVNENVLNTIRQMMPPFVYPCTTPICSSEDLVHGESHGTGTFVTLRGKTYILTNEHVPNLAHGRILSHFVGNGQLARRISNPFFAKEAPVDIAIARLEDDALIGGDRVAAPTSFIEDRFRAVAGEVMFFQGYPVANGSYDELSATLNAWSFSMVTDLVDLPVRAGIDPEKHIAIRYPAYVFDEHGEAVQTPDPVGLSGSSLWDTKFVSPETDDWGPQDARICAVIFGYHVNNTGMVQPDVAHRTLLAVKIEYAREFIVDALRHEAAYFRSQRMNTAPENALSDWLWAEELITDIV